MGIEPKSPITVTFRLCQRRGIEPRRELGVPHCFLTLLVNYAVALATMLA